MGVKLIIEVLDQAPADLTPAEVLVLVVLAEQARDDTRECWPGVEELTRRARLSSDGLRKVLQRLAGRGMDVRVAIGVGAKGKPIYAYPGHQTTYRLPSFERWDSSTAIDAGKVVPEYHHQPENAGTPVPPKPQNGGTPVRNGGTPVRNGGTPVPPFPSSPHIPSGSTRAEADSNQPDADEKSKEKSGPLTGPAPSTDGLDGLSREARIILTSLRTTHPDATPGHARAIWAAIDTERHPGNPTKYLTAIATGGGFDRWWSDAQAAEAAERNAVIDRQRRTGPFCPHGEVDATTVAGEPICPMCRHNAPEPQAARETSPEVLHILNVLHDAVGNSATTVDYVELASYARQIAKGDHE